MNLKESIRKVLKESNSLQSKLMQMMKTKGVDMTSEFVGGFNNLNKILKLDLDDINVQEMLVKNFINFVEIPEIEVTGLEIKHSSSGNRVINILFTTESDARNIDSWVVRNIIEYLSGFFPFAIKAVWEPSFGGKPKISLSSEIIKEDEDGNINESVLKEEEGKKLPSFYTRRIDHHKFEKMMRTGIPYIFHDSNSLEEFKYKLVEATLENYIHKKYAINIGELPQEDNDTFIKYMIEVYDPLLTAYYRNFYKR